MTMVIARLRGPLPFDLPLVMSGKTTVPENIVRVLKDAAKNIMKAAALSLPAQTAERTRLLEEIRTNEAYLETLKLALKNIDRLFELRAGLETLLENV